MTAMTLGTLGVLAAGTIAGIAVYNVASASTGQASSTLQDQSTAMALPEVDTSSLPRDAMDLPPLPEVPAPGDSPSTNLAEGPDDLTGKEASALVLAQAPGAAIATSATTQDGYRAWAIQVRRTDGSVVTGFVDRTSGVVFAWRVDQPAPAAGGYAQTKEYGEEHESEEHESDEHESEEHESDDD